MELFKKVKKAFLYFTLISSFVFILDFILPSKRISEDRFSVKQNVEQSYNAARNNYLVFYLETENRKIPCSEDFYHFSKDKSIILFDESPIFKEVNTVEIPVNNLRIISETHISRWFSGLILPLFYILMVAIGLKYKSKVDSFLTGIQFIFILHFIYLLN